MSYQDSRFTEDMVAQVGKSMKRQVLRAHILADPWNIEGKNCGI